MPRPFRYRSRHPLPLAVVVTVVGSTTGLAGEVAGAQAHSTRFHALSAPFEIGLLGDTGYSSAQDGDLLAVRASMAAHALAFEVHDGDIAKQGALACTDARLQSVHDVFDGFLAPFVYTPGDNEWADCPNPDDRLAAIRRIFFFASPMSLGQTEMPLTRQPGTPENARWDRDGVYFATLNVPGPRGTGGPIDADVAWLDATFDAATAANAAAVMIIQQDNPFSGGTPAALLSTLKRRTVAFGRPVVVVHGDTHKHRIDHPWNDVPNFTRVETFAARGSRSWVEAIVDPTTPAVFTFVSVTAP